MYPAAVQALIFDRTPRFTSDYPRPTRGPGEALIAMRVAGICDTDMQLVQGYMSYRGVLGHEFVGEVVEADDSAWIGKRVVADINAGCGACAECRGNNGHHCATRTVLGIVGRDGAFADNLVVPEHCLLEVPTTITDDQAVFAEPLAAALHVLDAVTDQDRAVILGDGKLGLLIAMSLAQAGLKTTIVGHHQDKLCHAVGAQQHLESDIPSGLSAPLVVEATGTQPGLKRALSLCQPRGTLVLKTTLAAQHAVDLSIVVVNELSIVGSRCGHMPTALSCLAHKRIDPRPLISARYPLTEAERALEHAARPGTLKVLIDNPAPS